MRPTHIVLLLFSCLLIVIVARPMPQKKQMQEEAPYANAINDNTFRVHFKPENDKDADLADILWFQRAAEIALELGVPGFNVLEQQISDAGVDGVIELEKDPMKAEYDANEILSLHLVEEQNSN